MRRVLTTDPVTFVCCCVIVAVLLLLAGLWLDAENRAARSPDEDRVERLEAKCEFRADGSVVCPAGSFVTTTTVSR